MPEVTREALEAFTKDELHDEYGVSTAQTKDEMISEILDDFYEDEEEYVEDEPRSQFTGAQESGSRTAEADEPGIRNGSVAARLEHGGFSLSDR